jgi:hypothetical protein
MGLAKNKLTYLALAIATAGCSSSPSNATDAGEGGPPTMVGPTCLEAMGNGPGSTDGILSAQGPNCLGCARDNGCLLDTFGNDTCCEVLTGNADGGGLSEAALCLQTMNDILASKCGLVMGPYDDIARVFEPGCLCGGATNTAACLSGDAGILPAGPIYQDYVDDFGTDIATIDTDFSAPRFGAGRADNILQCAFSFQCDCFGSGAVDAGVPDGGGSDDGGSE